MLLVLLLTQVSLISSLAQDMPEQKNIDSILKSFKATVVQTPNDIEKHLADIMLLPLVDEAEQENLYVGLAKVFYNNQMAEALASLNEQRFLVAAKQGNQRFNAHYWLYKKQIYALRDQRPNQITAVKKALYIVNEHQLDDMKDNVLFHLADAYQNNEQIRKAQATYRSLIASTENVFNKAMGNMRLGAIYMIKGDFEQALTVQTNALESFIELKNEVEVANTYYALANTNLFMQNRSQAVKLFKESKKIDIKLENKNNVAYSAIKLCEVYIYLEQYEFAMKECLQGKEIFNSFNSKANIAWADSILAIMYRKQKKYVLAENIMKNALEQNEEFMRTSLISSGYLSLGQSQLPQGKLELAHRNVMKALNLIEGTEHSDRISKTYLVLSEILEAQGDYKQAISFIKKHKVLYEEKRDAVREKQVTRLQNDIDQILKQKEIQQLEFETNLQAADLEWHARNIKIALFISPLGVFFLFMIFRLQIKKRQLVVREKVLLADLMAKKNRLLADVSHELSTPITVLKLQVEALQDDLEDDVKLTYNNLAAKLNDIERLISDIYQLARYDVGVDILQLDSINLGQHITQWGMGVEKLIEHHGLSFKYNNQLPSTVECDIDGERFNQLLTNLINNGIKYTDAPGVILVRSYLENKNVVIEVEDSSPGVAIEEHEKIFERLYRVDSSRSRETGGSGLGLAICHSIVKAHNGVIKAHDSLLGGLKVIIEIPLKIEEKHG